MENCKDDNTLKIMRQNIPKYILNDIMKIVKKI